MRSIIAYASHEGQTEKIAHRIAQRLSENGVPTDVHDVVKTAAYDINFDTYDAVILGSPLHWGQHDPRIAYCINQYHDFLTEVPTAFFSVSLGIVSKHPEDAHEAKQLANDFLAQLHWKPSLHQSFAGALRNSQYNWITKRLMHRAAQHIGANTDLHHDHEYTDWNQVDTFADQFTTLVKRVDQAKSQRPSSPYPPDIHRQNRRSLQAAFSR